MMIRNELRVKKKDEKRLNKRKEEEN